MTIQPDYSPEPADKRQFTGAFDRFYTRFAGIYDRLVKWLPLWRGWISQAIPHLQGPRVLEVSFGTGYLLTQYAGRFETYGLEYNRRMVEVASANLAQRGVAARLQMGNVEALPYADESFDSVVNTMAFTGYPDAHAALAELYRVLKPGGRLIMIDVNYPRDGNWPGTALVKAWAAAGDIIRDMGPLFHRFRLAYTDREIGGYGSVHLYLATKP